MVFVSDEKKEFWTRQLADLMEEGYELAVRDIREGYITAKSSKEDIEIQKFALSTIAAKSFEKMFKKTPG
ncbi:MAG: hypothetical protein ACE1ZC_02020 [Nitrososphaerales archaeon]